MTLGQWHSGLGGRTREPLRALVDQGRGAANVVDGDNDRLADPIGLSQCRIGNDTDQGAGLAAADLDDPALRRDPEIPAVGPVRAEGSKDDSTTWGVDALAFHRALPRNSHGPLLVSTVGWLGRRVHHPTWAPIGTRWPQEAVRLNRMGDFQAANHALEATAKRIRKYAFGDPELRDLAESLAGQGQTFAAPMPERSLKEVHFASANMARSRDAMGRSMRRTS